MRGHQAKREMYFSRSLWMIPLWFVFCAGNSIAQPNEAQADTPYLTTIIERVRANNPALKASRLEAEALTFHQRQVESLPDPRFGITYQPYPLLTARGTQRTQWRVDQTIPFPGKLALKGNVAALNADVAAYETLAFEQDLIYDAKQVYFELYRIQRNQELLNDFWTRLEDFEANAATRYEVGVGLQQAILKAQLERNTLLQRKLALDVQRRSSTEMLFRLMNAPGQSNAPDQAVEVGDLELLPLPALDHVQLLEAALAFRPEAQALESAEKKSAAEIAVAEKDFLPDFGFHITYFGVGAANVPATATGRDALALGVSLNIPIWRSRLNARLAEARVTRNQIAARIEGLHTNFRTQITDLVSRVTNEKAQVSLYQDALIPQAQTTLQATLSAYTTGRTNYLDLLDAERMLFSLQIGYEDTFARYLKAIAALERALGVDTLSEIESL